jgi:hypothetical protein
MNFKKRRVNLYDLCVYRVIISGAVLMSYTKVELPFMKERNLCSIPIVEAPWTIFLSGSMKMESNVLNRIINFMQCSSSRKN